MSILAGEMGRKAVDEATRNVAGDVATRGVGFDVPGERQGFGAKEMGRGETGRPGTGFDGPWDHQDRSGETDKRHVIGNETVANETRPLAETGKPDQIQETALIRDVDGTVKDYNGEVAKTSAGGEYQDVQSQNLERRRPEQVAEARSEFNKTRNELIDKWEETNQRKWPTYDEDVTTAEGKIIRKAGDRYDAHHVQPLELGGKNTAENITPMHAKDHFDKQGIHRPGGAYDNMVKAVKEA
jgi:hypothetical protein